MERQGLVIFAREGKVRDVWRGRIIDEVNSGGSVSVSLKDRVRGVWREGHGQFGHSCLKG
jgi:hypothetical protein